MTSIKNNALFKVQPHSEYKLHPNFTLIAFTMVAMVSDMDRC